MMMIIAFKMFSPYWLESKINHLRFSKMMHPRLSILPIVFTSRLGYNEPMKKQILIYLCLGVLMCGGLLFSLPETDVAFDDYFVNKTMRLDYFHTGTATGEHFSVDRIVADGPWSGSKSVLIDRLNLGYYLFEITDKEKGTLLYSRGYASIFGEWQTIPEAKKQWGTFHESIRFPWPKKTIQVVLKKRDNKNLWVELWNTEIDPTARYVNPADIQHNHKVLTLLENGPAEAKLDIVILGDGYSQDEMEKFRSDAQRVTDTLFTIEPYKSREADFNIRAIETPSLVSGVTRPHFGIFKRTPLSMHYSSFDSERYALSYDNRSIRDIASQVPYEFTIILMNERTYGGAGIQGVYASLAADNAYFSYLLLHELGHHLAGLADEYYSSSVSYEIDSHVTVEPWEPNITALLDKKNLKWKHLVKPGTPIPTPWDKKEFDTYGDTVQKERARLRDIKANEEEMEKLFRDQLQKEDEMIKKMKFAGKVGAFEGAGYLSHGLFRSSVNCMMFTRKMEFCPVCQEAIIKVIDQYNR